MNQILIYRNIFISLLIISFSSCQSDNLNGHWHIYEKRNFIPTDEYFTIDIKDNSIVIANKNSFEFEVSGDLIKSKKEINLPGECGSGQFNYKLKTDTIMLTGRVLGGSFWGIKCDTSCCSILNDYFNNIPLNIQPQTIDNKLIINALDYQNYLTTNIFVGQTKLEYLEFYGSDNLILIENSIVQLEDFEEMVEIQKSKINKNSRDRMNFIIHTNFNENSKLVFEIADELQKLNTNRVFVSFLKRNINSGENPFKIIHIDKLKS